MLAAVVLSRMADVVSTEPCALLLLLLDCMSAGTATAVAPSARVATARDILDAWVRRSCAALLPKILVSGQ
jgi:hypothetical protein